MVRSNFQRLHKSLLTAKVLVILRVAHQAQVHLLSAAHLPVIQGQKRVLVVCKDAFVQKGALQECELGDLPELG